MSTRQSLRLARKLTSVSISSSPCSSHRPTCSGFHAWCACVQITEGMQAYGVSSHRHMPEIEQGLADAVGGDVRVSFTPHLIPMSRGMQSTMYVQMSGGSTVDGLRETLAEFYKDEYFVRCVPPRSR